MVPLLKIGNHDNGERLDAVLARTYPQYSRAFFQKFLRQGGVTSSGVTREPDYRVHTGDALQVANFEAFTAPESSKRRAIAAVAVVPEVIFEDEALLIIDKPAGLVVHPAPGHRVGTLMDWLRQHLGVSVVKVFTDPERLGLVHRLDKDTSGVLVIAKSIISQTAISRQFADRSVKKTYAAFVEGIPSSKSGVITAPVGRSRKVPTRMSVSTLGRPAETAFEIKESLGEVALLNVHPKTGRTHQIRVHLAAIGHPIVGDRTYGSKSVWVQTYGIRRPLLHAERLELTHPLSHERVTYQAPWPADFHQAQSVFRQAFKGLLVLFAIGCLGLAPARAADSSGSTSSSSSSTGSSSSTRKSASHTLSRISELSSEIHKLQKQVSALDEKIAELQSNMEKIDLSDRMRDVERAVAELNSRAVATSASNEEAKTQLMEMNRRLKAEEDTIGQLRDQLDRIKRQVIQQNAVEAPSAAPTPAANPGNKP
jgi:23S rRNA pseudouridine1911/1915/1917 synthase